MKYPAVELGGLVDVVMGQAPPGDVCNKDGNGTVFVKAGEFQERHPVVREWTTKPLKLSKAGDVLVCVVGATAGKVNESAFDCAIGRSVAAVRSNPQKLDSRFLYHFFKTKVMQLRDGSQGAAQGVITKEMIFSLSVALFPLPEQRRIAAILDQADALRAKRREALAQLDSLTQSIFIEMFGDPKSHIETGVCRLLSDVVAPGRIVTYGIVQAGPEVADGVPYIRTGDIKNGVILENRLSKTTHEIAASYSRSAINTGDIVMSIRATVGTTALVPESLNGANLTQGTARISPSEGVRAEYLLSYLRTSAAQGWIQSNVKGATFREITLGKLRQLPVFVPSIDLQNKFVERIGAVNSLVTAAKRSLAEMHDLFASLQHRAFRGEL